MNLSYVKQATNPSLQKTALDPCLERKTVIFEACIRCILATLDTSENTGVIHFNKYETD